MISPLRTSSFSEDGGKCRKVPWRRGGDSNPRYGCPYAAFRVRCFQPLSHLSKSLTYLDNSAFANIGEIPVCYRIATFVSLSAASVAPHA